MSDPKQAPFPIRFYATSLHADPSALDCNGSRGLTAVVPSVHGHASGRAAPKIEPRQIVTKREYNCNHFDNNLLQRVTTVIRVTGRQSPG